MLEKAFRLIGEEKDGVISINKEVSSSYQYLNEEYESLKAEKDQIIAKDNTLSKRYNQFFEELKSLEIAKKQLIVKQEEIEWQTCLLSNQMEESVGNN